MKILFINNYPMDKAWKSWKDGIYPGHHLWGITHLHKYGIEVDILPHEKYVFLNKVGRSLRLGDYLDQQLRILFSFSQYDLIYSACQNNTFFLCCLQLLGFFKKPIFSIVHHPIDSNSKRNRIFINGHKKLICLSKDIKSKLKKDFNLGQGKVELLEWGTNYQKAFQRV